MLVATAGHVDHGKTTLVRALTGIDTDTLPEEKARGISIDLGFAYWEPAGADTIAFVDVPGHERFIRNMVCGVSAVDHVLLVVAADDGVMPQTREHLSIVELLGISQGTVAITKSDLVSPERLFEVQAQVRKLLHATRLAGAALVAVAAPRGEGIPQLQAELLSAASRLQSGSRRDEQMTRYVVDRVFSKAGSGTVVTGTVVAGRIGLNDPLVVAPGEKLARVRSLQRHGRTVTHASCGQRCAVNLAGIDTSALARGAWLVAPGAQAVTDRLVAEIQVLGTEKSALRHWTPVHVHVGAADVTGRLCMKRGASIAPGARGFAQLRLDHPVHAVLGDKVVLRDQSAMRTLAGATVIDPFAAKRSTVAEQAAVLEALGQPTARKAMAMLLENSAWGVDLRWFARVFNVTPGVAKGMLPDDAALVGEPRRAFGAGQVRLLGDRLAAGVARFQSRQPEAPGIDMHVLRAEVAAALPVEDFSALVKLVSPQAGLEVRASLVRLQGSDPLDNPRDQRMWPAVRQLLEDAGVRIPSARELVAASGFPHVMVRDLLHRASAVGRVVKITPERFALPDTLTGLSRDAYLVAQEQPQGLFSAAQYRDRISTGRTLAIEILECLDRSGVTRRSGEGRVYIGEAPQ